MTKKLKPMPAFVTDEEAERFVDEADLSEYDFSGMRPMRYEFGPTIELTIQMQQALLDDVKTQAAKDGVPYQRFIRQVLEDALAARQKKKAG